MVYKNEFMNPLEVIKTRRIWICATLVIEYWPLSSDKQEWNRDIVMVDGLDMLKCSNTKPYI